MRNFYKTLKPQQLTVILFHSIVGITTAQKITTSTPPGTETPITLTNKFIKYENQLKHLLFYEKMVNPNIYHEIYIYTKFN